MMMICKHCGKPIDNRGGDVMWFHISNKDEDWTDAFCDTSDPTGLLVFALPVDEGVFPAIEEKPL